MHHRPATDLIVALDFPRPEYALKLVDQLSGLPVVYKIGFEAFLTGGLDLVRELVHRKHRVFLDLKFHDIPNTVARAACQAAFLQVEMFTLHLAGGSQMVRAVAKELAEISQIKPKILGVTVLTSFDDVRWAEVTKAISGHAADVSDSVLGLAEHAVAWGVDGLVCSALELPEIRKTHSNLYTVVPGIRPQGWVSASSGNGSVTVVDDQARIMTPVQARDAGASAIVVGRPITQAGDARIAAESILKELSAKPISA
jgi:orotidine-5'-phosphate decarboxylase